MATDEKFGLIVGVVLVVAAAVLLSPRNDSAPAGLETASKPLDGQAEPANVSAAATLPPTRPTREAKGQTTSFSTP